MDSEDEREMEKQDTVYSFSGLEMRIHQNEERECLRDARIARKDPERDETITMNIARAYRVMRFFETIQGFHKGSLDLTGRHRRRYDSILSRWKDFSTELGGVLRNAQTSVTAVEIGGKPFIVSGEPILRTELEPESPERLDTFLTKWHAHDCLSLHELSTRREDTLKCLALHPTPKFQLLCLRDLPPELIHYIMDIAGVDGARRLGATCRLLREISSSYIFEHRSFRLDFMPDWDQVRSMESIDEKTAYMDSLITQRSTKLISGIDFIKPRSDILTAVRTLYVSDEWQSFNAWERTTVAADENSRHSFYAPLYDGISDLLPRLSNLQTSILAYWHITEEMISNFGCLKQLHTLKLFSCTSAVRFPYAIPKIPSLLNFQIGWSEEHCDSWLFLGMCPNIQNLFIWPARGGQPDPDITMPSIQLMAAFNPFKTLQRFNMSHVQPEWLPLLSAWIRSARDSNEPAGLHLTHFKLDIEGGLHRREIFSLLDSLSGAPIQFFVLDGLRYAAPDLFDRIAGALPQLEYLTLCYRESDIQFRTKDASWPFATWEYAPHFANFHHLRRFSWNYRTDINECGPSILQYFEQGFPDEQELWRMRADENDSFHDWECIAKLFAVFCPSLETLGFDCMWLGIRKELREDGQVAFVRDDNNMEAELSLRCNPSHESWPLCLPASHGV